MIQGALHPIALKASLTWGHRHADEIVSPHIDHDAAAARRLYHQVPITCQQRLMVQNLKLQKDSSLHSIGIPKSKKKLFLFLS